MNKLIFNRAMTIIIASFLCICYSCVNKEYELSEENLDMTTTLFQEGVSIPLGSTSKITLGSLTSMLDEETRKYLQQLENAYFIGISDSFDATKDIQDAFSGIGGLESVSMNEKFAFSLSNIDLSSISIEGSKIGPQGVNISEMVNIPDIKLPGIDASLPGISIDLPSVEPENLSLDLTDVLDDFKHEVTVVELESALNIPDKVKNSNYYRKPIDYNNISQQDRAALELLGLNLPTMSTDLVLSEYTVEVPLQITLPKEVQSVKTIKLDKNAKFEMVLEMENPLFTSGSFTPELTINLHDLFHIDAIESGFEDGGYMDHPKGKNPIEHHIHDKFVMSSSNGWKSDHVYHIDSLAVSESDWKKVGESLVLDKNVAITLSGNLTTQDLMTTLEHLENEGKAPMKLKIEIKFQNFKVDDVQMNIKPIEVAENLEMSFDVEEIALPEMVKKVDYVEFDENNPLTLKMSAKIPDMCSTMDISLESLKIEFPRGIEVAHDNADAGVYDVETRTLTYSDIKLSEGLDEAIRITKLNLDDPVGGKLSYAGKVKVSAQASAKGLISSKNILNSTGGNNLSVNVEVGYEPKLSDYCVVIDDYTYDVEVDPVNINTEIGSQIAEMLNDKPVTVTLKKIDGENPKIVINLNYPKDIDALKILPKKGEGLRFDFPDMISFAASSLAALNHDPQTNTIIFGEDDEIPSEIVLEITGIKVQPVEEDGKYYIKDCLQVSGGVRLAATEIHMKDIEYIQHAGAEIMFGAIIPTLSPAEIGLDEYSIPISESIDIEGMDIELPEMISSINISELSLKDVYLALDIDASKVATLVGDAKMTLRMDISLPEILMVEGVQNGNLHIEKEFENGSLTLDPIKIHGLNLSKIEVKDGKLTLDDMKVAVDGALKAEHIKINMDELEGKEAEVSIACSLASRNEDGCPGETIEIDKIIGNVGLQIDPVETTIDLSSIAEMINGENMSLVLDINTFWLSVDINTNVEVPVKGELEITPYYGDEPGQKKIVVIELDPSERVDDKYRIYISNKDPQTQGLTFVKLDLMSLLYNKTEGQKPVMASSLAINLNAGIDAEKECVIEPSKEYFFSADYEIGVPLELGEDFSFEYRDMISGLPEVVSELFAYGSLGLGGKITNGLPLRMDLQLRLLDAEGNVIPMKEGAGKMEIAPCDPTGRPVTTDVSLVLGGIDKNAPQLHAIEFVFTVDTKGAAGVPLTPDSFLQAKLGALIPDGVTLDLNSLLNGENNENDEDNE